MSLVQKLPIIVSEFSISAQPSHTMILDTPAYEVGLFVFNDEKDLIEACLSGNEEGWTALLHRYGRLIYTIPLRFGFSEQAAEEVFQETCVTIFEKLSELRDCQRLAAWIVTITKRRCIQRQRDLARAVRLNSDPAESFQQSTLEEELISSERRELVRLATHKLDDRCKELLQHLFFENPDLSYDELAQMLSIPRGSIGPLRGRCLEKLRHEFQVLEVQRQCPI